MKHWRTILTLAIFGTAASTATAAEPNETFATATMLPPGTLTVADEFTPPGEPDTLLGVYDQFGFVEYDEDSSVYGNGLASGAFVVPTNSGEVEFTVTGTGDFDLNGGHSESGAIVVYVDVFDFFEDLVAQFREIHFLEPGNTYDFFESNFDWIEGTYDVYVDNVISGDVDFFTFTGLTPGGAFTAETFDPQSTEVDTLLGWFDSTGALIEINDDIDETTLLSKIEGTVPANGRLTFAVSGFGDEEYLGNDAFIGAHAESGSYELRLTAPTTPVLAADFDDNGSVNGADLAIWRGAYGVPGNTSGNADGDNDTDGADFLVWQRERGSGPLQAAAVPEPRSFALVALALMCHGFARKR
jgi:hypothetical protein